MIYSIYKITIGDKCYIGSSKNIQQRWRDHIIEAYTSNMLLYKTMREFTVRDCIFEIICDIDCETRLEALKVEQIEIDKIDALKCLNQLPAYLTIEQKKEHRCVTEKESKRKNADKNKITKRKYYEQNTDKIKAYQANNVDKIKAYREKNADKIKAYQKEYREKNKINVKS